FSCGESLSEGLAFALYFKFSATLQQWHDHGNELSDVLLFVVRMASGGALKLDLLAIAPHPDDVELTCGGTLLKAAEQGYKTGILDLTAGEMGTRGTPE